MDSRAQPATRRLTALAWRCLTALQSGLCASVLALGNTASAASINVLWYTYADPSSEYVSFYSALAGNVGSYPGSAGRDWNLTFFGPSAASPSFSAYDVLVIESGEAFRTGAPGGPLATPSYSGILNNKSAIEAARGNHTFISGADADFHAVRGDSGLCPDVHCGNFNGARGYVINAINWAASGAGLGVVSFYHGEFPGSFWWDDPSSFLRSELQGNWVNFNPDENAIVISAAAAGFPSNQGLTSEGLSNWFNSFHGGFSSIPNYSSTADSGSHQGYSVSLASIALCQPASGKYCISATLDEPSSAALVAGLLLLLLAIPALSRRANRP